MGKQAAARIEPDETPEQACHLPCQITAIIQQEYSGDVCSELLAEAREAGCGTNYVRHLRIGA